MFFIFCFYYDEYDEYDGGICVRKFGVYSLYTQI